MATSDVTALQRSDLNEFLFADVGPEASGMMLSVVSLFARQGSDPWREADRLAALPKPAAADSLARAIADMPQGHWSLSDAVTISGRLIGLLPTRPARAERRTAQSAAGWLPVSKWVPSSRNAVVLAIVALGIVFAISTMTNPPAARFDGGDVGSFSSQSPAQSVPRDDASGLHAPLVVAPNTAARPVVTPKPGVLGP